MAGFIEGPWVLTQDTGWPWDYRLTATSGKRVLTYELATYSTSDTQKKANARPENDEVLATARLIAAAPELFAVASSLYALARIKFGNLDPDANAIFAQADAAIAKATGATP